MTQRALWAPVKWAQRKDSLYVTVDLPDVKDEKVILTNSSLKFLGSSNQTKYEVNLEFLHEVDTDAAESKWAKTDRNVHFYILKKDKEAAFWPHLLKDKHLEKTNVKVDWNKFVDEDDDDDTGFDMSALSGGGGFDINQMMAQQGANLPDEEDSDDEDLPDLEE
ncbi:unnamed protein product [Aphanomyces euteiches]|uniref:CS domain-containing protein n=1 Tax=Aphanomyces euteiches TaxID=100861 RepID=A0A6G0XG85_9STRA|nr:hypothetical protein Ae201684_005247 [Aphanomyces euteiches]KAG9416208.1 Prostaglandin E synthase 3 (Cytosolic) [Aphanomyces cochlioides]KAH9053437.1 hypothetical protein Ae201684P_015206 [Aphanomyces euteiches]KAH9112001.1 hypothetical protein LEN26_013354 [Aphanomyces euteiches]KAH9112276.1 hypothetical protein AeMF1_013353 [Aphanomyces euteiches]